ncbi:MAG: hypothetical protein R2698_06930 [Microthrixaceae bacterium]
MSIAVLFLVFSLLPISSNIREKILFAIAGFLTSLIVKMLFIARESQRRAKDTIASINSKFETVLTRLFEHFEPAITYPWLLTDGKHELSSPTDVYRAWLYLLYRMKSDYCATNYISDIYHNDWAKAALAVQAAKKLDETSTEIRKVLIFDDEEELIKFSHAMEKQRQIGIKVQYILNSEIDNDAELSRLSGNIRSRDFGFFDGERVLVWDLDDQRRPIGGSVEFGRETLSHYERFFRELYKRASEIRTRSTVHFLRVRDVTLFAKEVDEWRDERNHGYRDQYANMDYALRAGVGWLSKFGTLDGTLVYGAYDGSGEAVGFSMLIGSGDDRELYVAVRPGRTHDPRNPPNHRYGSRLTHWTVDAAFSDPAVRRVHLKVRPLPEYRVGMYERAGFTRRESTFFEHINGEPVEFQAMALERSQWERGTRSEDRSER